MFPKGPEEHHAVLDSTCWFLTNVRKSRMTIVRNGLCPGVSEQLADGGWRYKGCAVEMWSEGLKRGPATTGSRRAADRGHRGSALARCAVGRVSIEYGERSELSVNVGCVLTHNQLSQEAETRPFGRASSSKCQ